MAEKIVLEQGRPGRRAFILPNADFPQHSLEELLPPGSLRSTIGLPELTEGEVVRHIARLGAQDFSVDTNFYPLGSCTMKHNPRVHELLVQLPGFARVHPNQDPEDAQGALKLIYDLEHYLAEITGMAAATAQPPAGASGELTALMMGFKYFEDRGENRKVVLVPDSAHGTNPASAALYGYTVVAVKTDKNGNVNLQDLESKLTPQVAMFMLTIPSTTGTMDDNLEKISEMLHKNNTIFYADGANLNALVGIMKLGELVDIMHMNGHKTFTVPHGGGGPGSGPVSVREFLAAYLPGPRIVKKDEMYYLEESEHSIGKVSTFSGAFGALVRVHAYIRTMGAKGLQAVAENAVLNANYLRVKLKEQGWNVPIDKVCMHEVVLSASDLFDAESLEKIKGAGIRPTESKPALVVAKALLDRGIHAPTTYFPLIISEALMIEPTETETKETLDEFIEAMGQIRQLAKTDPVRLAQSPYNTPVKRIDDASANRPAGLAPTYDIAVVKGLLK